MAILHRTFCPVCKSTQITPVMEVRDHTATSDRFSIYECGDCSLRFTQDVPDAGSIGKYYQSEAYISHSDTRKGMINSLYHYVRNIAMGQKLNWVRKYSKRDSGALLDVGCGTGAFLDTMKNAGWKVTGIEPDETARKNARALHHLDPLPAEALFQLPDGSFDVITLWHVLEHVHELDDYISQIRKLLAPQGILLVALPNYHSLDAKYYGHDWAAYDVPRHLYHFSPKAFGKLAQRHQLKLLQQLPMPFDSFYISMLSEKYRRGNNHLLSAVRTGGKSYLHARKRTAEASSLVYVLEAGS